MGSSLRVAMGLEPKWGEVRGRPEHGPPTVDQLVPDALGEFGEFLGVYKAGYSPALFKALGDLSHPFLVSRFRGKAAPVLDLPFPFAFFQCKRSQVQDGDDRNHIAELGQRGVLVLPETDDEAETP